MPLMKGSSRAVIAENIRQLMHEGFSEAKALAAALKHAAMGDDDAMSEETFAQRPKSLSYGRDRDLLPHDRQHSDQWVHLTFDENGVGRDAPRKVSRTRPGDDDE